MPLLGLSAGAVQLLPLYELVQQNFREGSASYQQIVGWAWPDRHILTFFLPDVFGNPSHHHWFDLWALRWQPATVNWLGDPNNTIFWGIKNYVEGGNYLGVSTWLLAALAVGVPLAQIVVRAGSEKSPAAHRQLRVPALLFAALALVSLLFAFGTPLYGSPVLRPSRLGPASQPLQMGISLHSRHGAFGRPRTGTGPFLPARIQAKNGSSRSDGSRSGSSG